MTDGEMPALMIAVALADVAGRGDALVRAVDAGADAVLLEAGSAGPDEARAGIAAVRSALGVRPGVFLLGSPSVAGEAGAGALLPEHGMSSSEARRSLGPGPVLGREVGSPEAAALAEGVDVVVVTVSEIGAAAVRQAVEGSWAAVLARIGSVEEAVTAFAAGAEGVILPLSGAAAIPAIAGLLPSRERGPATVELNGEAVPLVPHSAITDLLADNGLDGIRTVTINGVSVPRRGWDDRLLETGDRIEAR